MKILLGILVLLLTVPTAQAVGINGLLTFENFLRVDNTSHGKYIPGVYECIQFSEDLVKEAKLHGYDLILVLAGKCKTFPKGHCMVAIHLDTGVDTKQYCIFDSQTGVYMNTVLLKCSQTENMSLIFLPLQAVKAQSVESVFYDTDMVISVKIFKGE